MRTESRSNRFRISEAEIAQQEDRCVLGPVAQRDRAFAQSRVDCLEKRGLGGAHRDSRAIELEAKSLVTRNPLGPPRWNIAHEFDHREQVMEGNEVAVPDEILGWGRVQPIE